ncbi:hypothetical protein [Nostoc sp. CCY 9925]|uniref:hypothetical protein n=1 Tax=Nostoc sp. CCY 9925 TaxID=3103865 RepID=UPI0039C75238
MKKASSVFTVEDLLKIKEYSRVAVLMPVYKEDVISCLGYNHSPIEALSPESFLELFENINNNGRHWNEVEKTFKERLEVMLRIHNAHDGDVDRMLQELDEMIKNEKVGDMTPIADGIRSIWVDLWYETDYNKYATQTLERFRKDMMELSGDIQLKIDLAENIKNVDIKHFLFNLEDEFRLIIAFSIEAEAGSQALWTQWSLLTAELEAAKDTASKVSQQSELVELYVALIDINGMLEESYKETQYMSDCFANADSRYENEYPQRIAPLGSYIKDSKDVTLIVSAQCQKADGNWNPSKIELFNFHPLMNLISNQNGELKLQDEGDWSNPHDGYCYYPAGSYRKSSKNIELLLTAQCKTSAGNYQYSTFPLTNEFIIKLKNDNGVLKKET